MWDDNAEIVLLQIFIWLGIAQFFYALILGPVIGEVTQTSAIILVEVEFKDAENPILQCQLFAKVI